MGNATSSTLENSLNKLSLEHLESFFNAVSTARDPDNESIPLMTKADFQKQFPSLSQGRLFGQNYYQIFDVEGLDTIDFASFFAGLAVLVNQKLDTKLDALFRLLDPAGNGILQEYELMGFVEKTFQTLHSLDPTIDWAHPVTIELSPEQFQLKLNQVRTNGGGNSGSGGSSGARVSMPTGAPLPSDVSLQYGTIPMSFGPIELCFDSQALVEKSLTAIGKVTPLAPAPQVLKPSTTGSKSNLNASSSTSSSTQQSTTVMPVTRSVNKAEFGQWVKSCPQLLLTIMWTMNISSIQYICQQTRLQFIQQCEADLAARFPMGETQVLEEYARISHFYHEVLIRRLALNNNFKSTSLLQSDIHQIQSHFNTDFSPAVIAAGATGTAGAASPEVTTPSSSSRRRSRFSFSRSTLPDDGTTDLPKVSETTTALPIWGDMDGNGGVGGVGGVGPSTNQTATQTLYPKVTQFNYPLTYQIPDSKIQLAPIGSQPPIQITTVINAGTAQGNLAALPTLTASPSQHNPSGTRSRANSSVRDGGSSESTLRLSSSNLGATTATVATFAANVNTAGQVKENICPTQVTAPFDIPHSPYFPSMDHQTDIALVSPITGPTTSTSNLTTPLNMTAVTTTTTPSTSIQTPAMVQSRLDFAQKCFPDSLPFTLLFITKLKLQSLLHRNRLVSKNLCENLMLDVQEDLNESYVGLIVKQYIYEMKQQHSTKEHTTTGAQHRSNSAYGDINHSLVQVLEQRHAAAAAATTTTNGGSGKAEGKDRRATISAPLRSGSATKRKHNPTSPTSSKIDLETIPDDGITTPSRPRHNLGGGKGGNDDDTDSDQDLVGGKSATCGRGLSGTRGGKGSDRGRGISMSVSKSKSKNNGNDDPLGLQSLELSTDSSSGGDEDDSDEEEISRKVAGGKLKSQQQKQGPSSSRPTMDSIFAHDALPSKNSESMVTATTDLPSSPGTLAVEQAFGGDFENPGYEHLMTEALIPTFLQRTTKMINTVYIPNARGPYAMPYLTSFVRDYLPDALGQLLAAYRHVLSRKIKTQTTRDTEVLFTDVKDYLDELLAYKQTVQDQFQSQQLAIQESKDIVAVYKSQHEDLRNELMLTKEQNAILKTELTDVISVKDMAIITLRDELQFFTKESQHWSDQITKLNYQVTMLKQERIQKDVEVAQLRAEKDAGGCCSIM